MAKHRNVVALSMKRTTTTTTTTRWRLPVAVLLAGRRLLLLLAVETTMTRRRGETTTKKTRNYVGDANASRPEVPIVVVNVDYRPRWRNCARLVFPEMNSTWVSTCVMYLCFLWFAAIYLCWLLLLLVVVVVVRWTIYSLCFAYFLIYSLIFFFFDVFYSPAYPAR